MPAAAEYGLTTFANPFSDIGRTAAQSLLSILQGGAIEPNCKRLPMMLIERSSVAPAKNLF
ncbi:MAG: substrate-binding domain-containing protein, partial [Armatimonadetes bacterium]|nr:substrate-binding domain-containing protein [Armatimonadota bacterium]